MANYKQKTLPMIRLFCYGVILVGLCGLNCMKKHEAEPSLYKITFTLVTDDSSGPTFQMSFKNFNIGQDFFRLNDSDIVKIKFAYPPQNNLIGTVYSIPRIDAGIITFGFMDTDLVGLDSVEIRDVFMKDIIKNRIYIYFNDSIIQSIVIDKEPLFEYHVGNESEISKPN